MGGVTHWSQVWSARPWRDEATGWIDDVLASHRIIRTGDVEQPRVRPWSTQLVAPTDRGRVWFKANSPHMGHEPALVDALADLLPRRVRAPLGTDAARGWMLCSDEGPRLDETPVTADTWCSLLRDAATMQRALVDHGERLLATGLPDLRPSRLAAVTDDLLQTLAALPPEHPSHLDAGTAARVQARLPRLGEAIGVLREGPVPSTLQHGDLHPGNVFARRDDGAAWRIFDFGDAQWAHPFEVLVVPVRVATEELGPDAAVRLVESYLEVWDDLAPRAELRRLVRAAAFAHAVPRALTWWQATRTMTEDETRTWGVPVRAWIERLADADAPEPP
ncbi:phosphotransferase [Solicola sp. PLA-1-18]|uniref:phosphotransferase n=1 Tax=Solicola sp. PLA-1-18 TaxID=3380532 RepID=UPI003B7A3A8B